MVKSIFSILCFLNFVGCCVPAPDVVYFSVYNDKEKSSEISFFVDGFSVDDLLIGPHAVALFKLENSEGCFWGKEKEFEKIVINGKKIGNLSPSGCIYSPMVCCYIIRGDSVYLRQIDFSDYGIDGNKSGGIIDFYGIFKRKPQFGEYKILHEYK